MDITIQKLKSGLKGSVEIPSDKSISHRAAMFSMLTGGICEITNFSKGADCHSTLKVIQQLGCSVAFHGEQNLIVNAKNAIAQPTEALDCGNSGTTMRLMAGILAGQQFNSTLTGDASLSKRPMKRIIEPLTLMGADIKSDNYTAPLRISGTTLQGIHYKSQLASAQVKSAILLAGLSAEGATTVEEPCKSRDHTELMLEYLGANISVDGNKVTILQSELEPKPINICGDISSAAFFMVAAAIVPGSEVILTNVGLNPTRAGIIDVMKSMNAEIKIFNVNTEGAEPVGDIKISYSDLKATTIEGAIIPRLIDELPVIALLATQAEGTTIIKNAEDLRNKEADRIKAIVDEFKKIGADIEETPDGFIVNGKTNLKGDAELCCYHDHRIAMTLYIAGLISEKRVTIKEFEWVNISFPEFEELMGKL